jgi:hypothetical protein
VDRDKDSYQRDMDIVDEVEGDRRAGEDRTVLDSWEDNEVGWVALHLDLLLGLNKVVRCHKEDKDDNSSVVVCYDHSRVCLQTQGHCIFVRVT